MNPSQVALKTAVDPHQALQRWSDEGLTQRLVTEAEVVFGARSCFSSLYFNQVQTWQK